MSGLDLAVLCGLGAAVAVGYRLGFRDHITTWVGTAAGLVFGLVVAWAATRGRTGWSAALVAAVGLFVPMLLGWLTGRAANRQPIYRQSESLDRIHGAIAGGLLASVVIWALVPVAAAAPGTMGERFSASATSDLVEWMPGPITPIADVAARVDEGSDTGEPDDPTGPVKPSTGPPDAVDVPKAPMMTDERRDEIRRSVVGVSGIACGRLVEGTGFVIEEHLVATNAHVVAGVEEVRIDTSDGGRMLGRVVGYDPAADIAMVWVTELEAPSLPLGPTPDRDFTGEVIGFALDGAAPVTPFRIAGEVTATGRDIYGEGEVRRQVLYVAAELDSGDSGAPLVSDEGVVGMVFAIAPGGEPLVFALTPEELGLPVMEDIRPVPTEECR